MSTISFQDFQKVDLRTAKVVAAEAHPDADKLIVVQADVGEEEPRQVVAGIRPWYPPEDLVGKTIVVVVNLEPVMLRGIESRGMLLAVQDGEALRLLTSDADVAPGRRVT